MKLADLNISNDACGPYVINIYGDDRNSFVIKNNALYFKDSVVLDSRVKNKYSIIIAVEDFSKRFPPLTQSYSVDIINCVPTTTTTTTTTTTAAPTVCAGNIIINGDFETGSDSYNGDGSFGTATGWTRNKVDVVSLQFVYPSQPRKKWVDLNALSAGYILQNFPTVIGQEYQVSFNYAANNCGAVGIKTARVSIYNTSSIIYSEIYTFDTTGTICSTYESMNWKYKTFTFKAISTTTTIKFESLSSGNAGPAVDNVCIKAI